MDFQDFLECVRKAKKEQPILFGLPQDQPVSAPELAEFEESMGIRLSPKYRELLLQFGGGFFGFASVYSLDRQSEFYLGVHNPAPLHGYLCIADNGCGDCYVQKIADGACQEPLYFLDHETEELQKTRYADILEYLICKGLQQS